MSNRPTRESSTQMEDPTASGAAPPFPEQEQDLPGLDARLQPQAEPFVPVPQGAARPADDGRGSDVHRVGVLVERAVEAVQLRQEPALRPRGPHVDLRKTADLFA